MWLLDTHTLTLHYFDSPEAVEEGYMILSHVWDESKEPEMSFQDIQRIQERCAVSGQDPHDLVNTKIRKCCELAERHGYSWAWIDTCCIDKTSSAELMEAINAMYRFYSLSLVCYVYLPDIWHDETVDQVRWNMRNSRYIESELLVKTRWHRRGWTLQELIAPRVVHFISRDWGILGTKNDVADGLELGLGIPASVLRHEQSPLEFSVAQRMSWAANRTTTRLEDEAYCLLGIFGINMPTLYGEGRRAFQRLQEEILKQTADSTLFAWGESTSFEEMGDCQNYAQAGLLATAPSDFRLSRGTRAVIPTPEADKSRNRIIRFRPTTHGLIFARIPVLYMGGQTFADLSWQQGNARLLLVLRLRTRKSHLPYPIYDIGLYSSPEQSHQPPLRLIKVQLDLHRDHPTSWRNILLLDHRPRTERKITVYIPMNHSFSPSIRIPDHIIGSLLYRVAATEVTLANAQLPWSGIPPLTISYRDDSVFDILYAVIQFGRCAYHSVNDKECGFFWANFRGSLDRRVGPSTEPSHQCPGDHILAWSGMERRFVLEFPEASEDPLEDHIAKWLLRMSFKLAEPTGVLVLTEISSQYRLLLKIFKYHDIQEEEEAEQGHVQASTMDTEHSTSPSLDVCCHLDEGVVPSLLNPANVAASVT